MTACLRRSISFLLGPLALLFALACLGTAPAHACPRGTVFSAYNGNGICAYEGQGATVAVQCTKMVNSCPPGTTHEHKKRGDTGDYCCAVTIANEQGMNCAWVGTPPACEGQCGAFEVDKGSARDYADALHGALRKYADSFGKSCMTGSKVLCCHHSGLN